MFEIIKKMEIYISSLAFVVMILVVIINVFSRFLFNHSFSFTEEIAFIGFTYTVFFGMSMLYRTHSLIAIDLFVDRLPKKFKKITKVFNFTLLIFVNLYLLYLSVDLTISAWVRPTAALRIPYTFVDLAATVAFTFTTLYSIKFLIQTLRGAIIGEAEDSDMNTSVKNL